MQIIEFAGGTDVGKQRKDNQDAFICTQLWSANDALLAVIDGVGGYAGGDVAAAIAKDAISQYMTSPKGDTLTMLREAVVFANNKIVEERNNDRKYSQMCCVLTAAVADAKAGRLFFVHVGDTRLYRLRDGALEKLSKDHSMVGIREDAGELTEAEAMNHPRRNEIMREVGSTIHRIDDREFLDYEETDFQPGDLLLICSDGLSDMLTASQMKSVLTSASTINKKIEELIVLANQQGGNDNITLVLARNLSEVVEKSIEQVRKKTPNQVLVSSEAVKEPFTTQQKPAPSSKYKLTKPLLIIVLIIAAVSLWLWMKEPGKVAVTPSVVDTGNTDTGKPNVADLQVPAEKVVPIFLVAALHARDKDKHLRITGDTMILSEPLVWDDSLIITGNDKRSVLIPAAGFASTMAFDLGEKGNLTLENLVVSGFQIGVVAGKHSKLHLKNVIFKNIMVPVSLSLKNDSAYNGLLNFSTITFDSLPAKKPN